MGASVSRIDPQQLRGLALTSSKPGMVLTREYVDAQEESQFAIVADRSDLLTGTQFSVHALPPTQLDAEEDGSTTPAWQEAPTVLSTRTVSDCVPVEKRIYSSSGKALLSLRKRGILNRYYEIARSSSETKEVEVKDATDDAEMVHVTPILNRNRSYRVFSPAHGQQNSLSWLRSGKEDHSPPCDFILEASFKDRAAVLRQPSSPEAQEQVAVAMWLSERRDSDSQCVYLLRVSSGFDSALAVALLVCFEDSLTG